MELYYFTAFAEKTLTAGSGGVRERKCVVPPYGRYDKDYLCGLFFFLDLIATLSLIPDIPFIDQAMFGTEDEVWRLARLTTRSAPSAGAIVRVSIGTPFEYLVWVSL